MKFLAFLRLILLVALTLPSFALAQNVVTIKGMVTDEQSNPLPGITVVLNNSEGKLVSATATDKDGLFALTNVPPDETYDLSFSAIGFKKEIIRNFNVAANENNRLLIKLSEDISELDDVVVVGYGKQSKNNVTGSIASVKATDIKDQPIGTFDAALAGKMAGVEIVQSNPKPGAGTTIRIRGLNTITAGSGPLLVVDGLPLDNQAQAISSVNVSDIASIEVLKDAAAAAIYGSRGSNGVVLITTKQGEPGKMKLTYNYQGGYSEVSKKIPMLDAYQYARLAKDGHDNAYLADVPSGSADDPDNIRPVGYQRTPPDLYPYLEGKPGLTNTDWQDAIFRKGMLNSHSLSVSGGTDAVKYFISGNYLNQEGAVINSGYKRYGARVNVEAKHNKLRVGANFTPTYELYKNIQSDGVYTSEGVIASALQIAPVWPIYNEDGTFNYDANGKWRISTDYQHNEVLNPVALATLTKNEITHFNLLGRAFLDYELIKGLNANISVGATINDYHQDYFRPSTLPARGLNNYTKPSNPVGRSSSTFRYNWVSEQTLTYNKYFKSHHVNLLAGFTAQKDRYNQSGVDATNYPNNLVQTINGGQVTDGDALITEWSLLSAIGRLQYDYKSKYLLAASLRRDGSSKFGKNNKWGNFPSVSAGWVISSEDFMQPVHFVSKLKTRASYGVTGNFQIGNYQSVSLISPYNYTLGNGNGTLNTGYAPSSIANPDLSWEKSKTYDIGLDLGLFNDILTLTIDYYNTVTSGLLLKVPVPYTTGFNTALQNIGKVNNKGFEFTATGSGKVGKLNFNISGNIATNKNKVLALGPGDAPIIASNGTSNTYFITEVGSPIGSYYLPVVNGIFKSQEELDAYPHLDNTKVGDFKFVDLDGDGKIDLIKDRAIVGKYFPDYTYGLNLRLDYRGFDFSISLQGAQGFQVVNLLKRYIDNMEGNFNGTTNALNRFVSEDQPGNGSTVRANRKATGNNGTTSTFHVEDGSYTRLQNIALGYSLPPRLLKYAKLSNVRVYISVQNLHTWTKYSGYNPQVNLYSSDALTPGIDYGSYPFMKTYTAGATIGF